MRNFKRMVLLSLAVLGTAFAFADGDSEMPMVDVSPKSAVITTNVKLKMTVTYWYTRHVVINAVGAELYTKNIPFWNEYKSNPNSFKHDIVIGTPNTIRTYKVTVFNDGHEAFEEVTYMSTDNTII